MNLLLFLPDTIIGIAAPSDAIGLTVSLFYLVAVCVIFIMGCRLVLALWKIVFDAFTGSDEAKAKLLRDLVGGLSIGGKVKMVGVGLSATLLVLFFCVEAIKVIDIQLNAAPKLTSSTSKSKK